MVKEREPSNSRIGQMPKALARKVTFLRWDVILRRLLDVPVKRPETTAFLGQSN